jgi:ADA HAT complex component 1
MFSFSSWIAESKRDDETTHGIKSEDMADEYDGGKTYKLHHLGFGKRRREDEASLRVTEIDTDEHTPKRRKADKMGNSTSAHESPKMSQPKRTLASRLKDPEVLRHAKETIESQFALEILLKHKELTLIDQELGKAQVALEQLRRCHLIPFPVAQGSPEAMLNVSAGAGSSLPQAGGKQPKWASPFGVTEGAYSRHYAKWLIPDERFDGVVPQWQLVGDATRATATIPEGRTTRNSLADVSTPVTKSRRGAFTQKLHALPSGYAHPKENAGPSVLKRADGQMVKLVCLDCKRENFGSTQGFINHCRIAHRREFKSHEEAASQAGVPIDSDQPVSASVPPTPAVDDKPVSPGLVHPLIIETPSEREAAVSLMLKLRDSIRLFHEGKLPGLTHIPGEEPLAPKPAVAKPTSKSFVPAMETPNLSDLLKSRGFDKNLADIVGDAKSASSLHETSEEDGDADADVDEEMTDQTETPELPAANLPHTHAHAPAPILPHQRLLGFRPTNSQDVRQSRFDPGRGTGNGVPPQGATNFAAQNVAEGRVKGFDSRFGYASPLMTGGLDAHDGSSTPTSDRDEDVVMRDCGDNELSPSSTTATSNNAPSLVSDDGEYSAGSGSEASSVDDSAAEDEDLSDVAEIEIDEEEKVVARRQERRGGARLGESVEALRRRKEERHVSFLVGESPVKEIKAKGRGKK